MQKWNKTVPKTCLIPVQSRSYKWPKTGPKHGLNWAQARPKSGPAWAPAGPNFGPAGHRQDIRPLQLLSRSRPDESRPLVYNPSCTKPINSLGILLYHVWVPECREEQGENKPKESNSRSRRSQIMSRNWSKFMPKHENQLMQNWGLKSAQTTI